MVAVARSPFCRGRIGRGRRVWWTGIQTCKKIMSSVASITGPHGNKIARYFVAKKFAYIRYIKNDTTDGKDRQKSEKLDYTERMSPHVAKVRGD
jgi:hypothetical protein